MEGERGSQDLAADMVSECATTGQSARQVTSGADELRAELRARARLQGLRIRTARMDDVVVVARLDARLWNDDRATMRAKLTPPG